jgi:hypothetical protein
MFLQTMIFFFFPTGNTPVPFKQAQLTGYGALVPHNLIIEKILAHGAGLFKKNIRLNEADFKLTKISNRKKEKRKLGYQLEIQLQVQI